MNITVLYVNNNVIVECYFSRRFNTLPCQLSIARNYDADLV
jgi:hypothetical protein